MVCFVVAVIVGIGIPKCCAAENNVRQPPWIELRQNSNGESEFHADERYVGGIKTYKNGKHITQEDAENDLLGTMDAFFGDSGIVESSNGSKERFFAGNSLYGDFEVWSAYHEENRDNVISYYFIEKEYITRIWFDCDMLSKEQIDECMNWLMKTKGQFIQSNSPVVSTVALTSTIFMMIMLMEC